MDVELTVASDVAFGAHVMQPLEQWLPCAKILQPTFENRFPGRSQGRIRGTRDPDFERARLGRDDQGRRLGRAILGRNDRERRLVFVHR